jgi:hypothetical protein
MDREPLEFDDEALTRYFRGANEDLDADEFAASVLRRARHRTRRRERIRQLVLGPRAVGRRRRMARAGVVSRPGRRSLRRACDRGLAVPRSLVGALSAPGRYSARE